VGKAFCARIKRMIDSEAAAKFIESAVNGDFAIKISRIDYGSKIGVVARGIVMRMYPDITAITR